MIADKPEEFKDAIVSLFNDRDLRNSLIDRSQIYLRNHYNLTDNLTKLINGSYDDFKVINGDKNESKK